MKPMKMIVLAAGLGTRMRAVTGGRPKLFVEVGGMTLLDRLVAMAEIADLEPVVVTRPELVADFRGTGLDVLVEEELTAPMVTLSNTRRHLREPFVWIAGDMLLTDLAPVRAIVQAHREEGSAGSFLYARTDRFKAKLSLRPQPEVLVTREGTHSYSLLTFGVQSPRLFDYLPGDLGAPRENFVQRAIEHGEPLLFREYRAPVFEIDTPDDLAAARRCFETPAQAS
jgi:NDP-sugar pyrophosphorylase family protein